MINSLCDSWAITLLRNCVLHPSSVSFADWNCFADWNFSSSTHSLYRKMRQG